MWPETVTGNLSILSTEATLSKQHEHVAAHKWHASKPFPEICMLKMIILLCPGTNFFQLLHIIKQVIKSTVGRGMPLLLYMLYVPLFTNSYVWFKSSLCFPLYVWLCLLLYLCSTYMSMSFHAYFKITFWVLSFTQIWYVCPYVYMLEQLMWPNYNWFIS